MSNYFVHPASVVGGVIRVPGDKSISHRSLMLGGIAEGITEVRGFLESEDCLSTMKAMRALGVRVEQTGATEVRVHGVGLRGLQAPAQPLDMGNAGTAIEAKCENVAIDVLELESAASASGAQRTGEESRGRRKRAAEPV